MSGIEGSMIPEDMKLVAIKVGIGLLVVAVLLFSAWLFFRYKFRKQVKPLEPLKVIDLDPKPQDRDPEEGPMSSMMEGFAMTSEEYQDARAPIRQGPYIFVVPVTQAMLASGRYTSEGSRGWLMQHAGLVGQPLAVTAAELQDAEVILKDVLPGGAGKPKVSVLHLASPSLGPDERTFNYLKPSLYGQFLALFRAMAAAQLEPGATLVIPMIHYEGSGIRPEVYREAFVHAFTEAASAVTGERRQSLASSLGVEQVRVHCSKGREWACMARHFQLFCMRVDEVLEQQPGRRLVTAIQSVSEDVAAEAAAAVAAVAPNPELDPNGELDGAGLDGADLGGARGSP